MFLPLALCARRSRLFTGTWSGAFRAAAQLYKEGGSLSLLQGHSATLLRIFPYAAIKFMAYDQLENVRISVTSVRISLCSSSHPIAIDADERETNQLTPLRLRSSSRCAYPLSPTQTDPNPTYRLRRPQA